MHEDIKLELTFDGDSFAQEQENSSTTTMPEQHPKVREADLSDPVFLGALGALTIVAVGRPVFSYLRDRYTQ